MMSVTTLTETHLPGHDAAMQLAEAEYGRFVDLLSHLEPEDWGRPTDCTLWSVKEVVAHCLANMEANHSISVLVHQLRTAAKRAKKSGNDKVTEMTALQVEERSNMTGAQMAKQVQAMVPLALKGRTRVPAIVRRLVKIEVPPPHYSMTLGYLIDHVYTRDVWMHRVDISRATGRDMALEPRHDRDIVATIACDWELAHGQPYELILEGPAGGVFTRGEGGERYVLDAVEFCRIVSGRDPIAAVGLLQTPVLF